MPKDAHSARSVRNEILLRKLIRLKLDYFLTEALKEISKYLSLGEILNRVEWIFFLKRTIK